VSVTTISQQQSDEQLMQSFLAGEAESLEHLVKRYEGPLFGFAAKILGSREAAQDAFQETFLKVYRKRRSYRAGCRFRPWLYQICLNVCRDMLRCRKRRAESSLGCEGERPDAGPGPEERVVALTELSRVKQAFRHLSPEHREVLLLAHHQGFTHTEISQILEVPLGTVKSRCHHAVKKIARFL